MVVYVEYAFLQNFFFDGALLCLSFMACKAPLRWGKIAFSAFCGGIFAIVYPLLSLSTFLGLLLKIAVGFLLCLLAFDGLKTKNGWGRYALSVALFFLLTFACGGALSALQTALNLSALPKTLVIIGFFALCLALCVVIAKLYQKRRLYAYIYPCKIVANGKEKTLQGYLDSGNLASKNGLPVCFLSPDVFYDFFGEEMLFGGGQVRDEIKIVTMSGERSVCIKQGEIEIKIGEKRVKKQVYFALGANMIGREYQILLNGLLLEV